MYALHVYIHDLSVAEDNGEGLEGGTQEVLLAVTTEEMVLPVVRVLEARMQLPMTMAEPLEVPCICRHCPSIIDVIVPFSLKLNAPLHSQLWRPSWHGALGTGGQKQD